MNALFSYWHLDLSILFLICVLTFTYLFMTGFKLNKKSFYFLLSLIIIIIAEASPLHFLGEHYLFSAHMTSHVLLVLVAAPLLVLCIPEDNRFQFTLKRFSKIRFPVICWFAGVGVMWIWHIPSLFNYSFSMHGMSAANMNHALMFLETISLLLGGFIFWWPIINPYKNNRLASLSAVLYLSVACVFCSLLGLLITFAPVGIFTPYLNPADSFGLLPIIRNQWQMSAAADQQIAGLIMWVPCCFIYLTTSMILLLKWFNDKPIQNPVITPITT